MPHPGSYPLSDQGEDPFTICRYDTGGQVLDLKRITRSELGNHRLSTVLDPYKQKYTREVEGHDLGMSLRVLNLAKKQPMPLFAREVALALHRMDLLFAHVPNPRLVKGACSVLGYHVPMLSHEDNASFDLFRIEVSLFEGRLGN